MLGLFGLVEKLFILLLRIMLVLVGMKLLLNGRLMLSVVVIWLLVLLSIEKWVV